MKPEEIQDLLSFISTSGLDEVNIETDKFKISVKRASAQPAPSAPQISYVQAPPAPQQSAPAAPQASAAPAPQDQASAQAAPAASQANRKIIKSPMIGTFYLTPKPGEPPFVSLGGQVSKGQTVGIIEAMKLFNEIECEFTGKIVEILADNASPVEYDQPLFAVEV